MIFGRTKSDYVFRVKKTPRGQRRGHPRGCGRIPKQQSILYCSLGTASDLHLLYATFPHDKPKRHGRGKGRLRQVHLTMAIVLLQDQPVGDTVMPRIP